MASKIYIVTTDVPQAQPHTVSEYDLDKHLKAILGMFPASKVTIQIDHGDSK